MKKIFLKIAFVALNILALDVSAQVANLLVNPGFVPTNTASYKVYGLISPPSWTNIGPQNGPLPNNIFVGDPSNPTPNPMPSYKGSLFFYDLGGYGNAGAVSGDGVSQTFATVPGRLYRLTFGHNSEANGINSDAQSQGISEVGKDSLRVMVGDQNIVFDSPYNASSPGYGFANGGTFGGAIVGAWQMPWVERTVLFKASTATTKIIFSVNEVSSIQFDQDTVIPNGANSQIIAMPVIQEVAPTIVVTKVLGGAGRISANADQFTVSINSAGVVQNDTSHSTTAGSGNVVTTGSGTTGIFSAKVGVQYNLNEVMASGSSSSLGQYGVQVNCVNSFVGGTNVSGINALGANFTLNTGDVISCTITNSPAVPRLTIKKMSVDGIGSFVFNGTANANGFSTDDSYIVKTGMPNVAASGPTVFLSAVGKVTEIQEKIPAGWFLIGASCIDANAGRTGNPSTSFGTFNGNTLQIPAINTLAGADLQCTFVNSTSGFTLMGKVLLDTGAGSGTPHDAIQNGTEVGHSGVPLTLTNCAGTVFSSAISAADGSFVLGMNAVPSGQAVCLVESLPLAFNAVSVNVGNTVGSYNLSSTTLRFTPAANTSYSGVILGEAPQSTLAGDGARQSPAGLAVIYAHTYTAGSAGKVSFSTVDASVPKALIWTSQMYLDVTCNGLLDAMDTVITAPIAVQAGQRVCILNKVTSQSGASIGSKDLTTVSATESWNVPTLTPVIRIQVLQNMDTTTVSTAGLALQKDVRVLASCPVSAAASLANTTPYTTGGSAKPGEFLEYRLQYSNGTAEPLTGIRISDSVPSFTQFVSAQCLGNASAPGVTCAVSSQPNVGATNGAISWNLQDTATAPVGLQPLASGAVSFCLQVQQ